VFIAVGCVYFLS